MIGFGLSAGNIERLMQGQPIKINKEEMNLPHDVIIFYGRTEEEMKRMLVEEGFITDQTKINEERK